MPATSEKASPESERVAVFGKDNGIPERGWFHINMPERFSVINKLIQRDLNNRSDRAQSLTRYSKDDVNQSLRDPDGRRKELRAALLYVYTVSSHFRRLIDYFASLSDLSYVVSPTRMDPEKANQQTVSRNYRKVLNVMSAMNVKNQFPKILTVCLREDIFYGTLRVTSDVIMIQQLPSDYCAITTQEGFVFNVTFDFSYFDVNASKLPNYTEEFTRKYNIYKNDKTNKRWQELDAPLSFAIKCNPDVTDYPVPPFAGVLREVYDIEDYRNLKLTKTALENYAVLVMTLGMNSDGQWEMDYNKAVEFWKNLNEVVPEEVGTILSPMHIDKISFEKSNTGDPDTIAEAVRRA